jgi:Fe-S cluster assembly protein SufD
VVVQNPFETVTKLEELGIVEDAYLMDLLKQSPNPNHPAWLVNIKQQASQWITRLRLPHRQDEEWRFTDLSALLATNFTPAKTLTPTQSINTLPETAQTHLVFVNGIYNADLSDTSGLPDNNIFVGNISKLPEAYHDRIPNYFARQHGAEEVFTTLNTASFQDGSIVWIGANIELNAPIHLIFLTVTAANESYFSQPRTLIVAERGAKLTLIEEYIGGEDGCYFNNAVTEIYLEENAEINHTRLQLETGRSFHVGKSAISQGRDSRYTCNEINFGAALSRHNLEILQQGEQTETYLNGLTVITAEQIADTHSIIALTKPHGTTDQLHKCIVDDRGTAIFNGKVFVPKAAQLTNAAQLNRNLLLSPKARVNTKPELQITADNVKCSHGATVSQLEADEIFYLRSRGLNDTDARHLLVDAFAGEIIDRLPLQSLKNYCNKHSVDRLN